jgi:hypothetical protein
MLEGVQADRNVRLEGDNLQHPHHGLWSYRKNPMQMLLDGMSLTKEQVLAV